MDSLRMESNESGFETTRVDRSGRIAALREMIGVAEGYRERECFPLSGLEPGVPRGALVEVSGPGKTELMAKFLVENPELKVAWIEEDLSVYPCGFLQRRAGLGRILFIESGRDSRWSVFQALRSQVFGVVLFSSTTTTTRGDTGSEFFRDERTLRSLQLAAEKSRASMIFLTENPGDSWPVSLQLQVSKDAGLRVRVLKRRH